MAAAASASAVVEESEPERSAVKRKKIDLAEAVEHEKAAAVEGVEHEQSAAMEVVVHEKAAVVEGLEHEKSAAGDGVNSGVFIEEYLQYELPFRPGLIYYRNDEELALIRKILAEEHRIVWGEDDDDDSSDCVSEDSDDMDDESRRYKEQFDKSDGFDIDFVISKSFWGAIYPVAELDREKYDGMVDRSAKFAIKNYNEQHQDHEKLELVKVDKANVKICAGYYFYITLEAKNIATSKVKTYQAKVDYVFGNEKKFKVPIFREKAEN